MILSLNVTAPLLLFLPPTFKTRIPKLVVTREGDDVEIEVSDNPYDVSTLDVSRVPVLISLSLVGVCVCACVCGVRGTISY